MKNKIKITGIITIILAMLILFSANKSYAEERFINEDINVWQQLSEEEKKKSIEPIPIKVDLNDAIKRSKLNILEAQLGTTLPSTYSLSNMTVRNQDKSNMCWAFTTTNLISTNIQKVNNTTTFTLLSPKHINYKTSSAAFSDKTNSDGYNRTLDDGANHYMGLIYSTAGYGPILETQMPFDGSECTQILSTEMPTNTPTTKVDDFVQLPAIHKTKSNNVITYKPTASSTSNYTDAQATAIRNLIKEQIQNYGAVGAYLYVDENDVTKYFNSTDVTKITSYYCNNYSFGASNATHNVTIVGWDDDYAITNFNSSIQPVNKGAYKVLNSWGTEWGDGGYFYVSYDDPLIEIAPFGVVKTSKIDYDNLYQYDNLGYDSVYSGETAISTLKMSNVFSTKTNNTGKLEYINKVSLYVPVTSTVTISVNGASDDKNNLTDVATSQALEAGYHTIALSSPVRITGKSFVIAAKYYNEEGVAIPLEYNFKSNGSTALPTWDTATASSGQSYIYDDSSSTWKDVVSDLNCKDTNVCLKAFTTYVDKVDVTGVSLNSTSETMEVGDSKSLIATVTPTNATEQNVTWSSSDETVAKVSTGGVITALKAGTTTITVTTEDGSKTATCKITVKEVTNTDDEIYKDGNNTASSTTTTRGTTDTTVAKTILPNTGVKIIVLIVIIVIAGIGIFAFIRYKRIDK